MNQSKYSDNPLSSGLVEKSKYHEPHSNRTSYHELIIDDFFYITGMTYNSVAGGRKPAYRQLLFTQILMG